MADITQLTDQQREQLLLRVVAVTAEFRKMAEVIAPAVTAAAQSLADAFEALKKAGLIDEDGKPVKAADRPAWQSPYGPPQSRR